MAERNARPNQAEPSKPDLVDKSESAAQGSSQSEINSETAGDVKTWSDGFVKPDGTRVQLFVPRAAAA